MSKYLTLVAVGDRDSKKTELLLKYTGGRDYSERYNDFIVPEFQNSVHTIIVDRIRRTVHFVDSEPDDDYTILRRQTYEKADCILLCYSTRTESTFSNLHKKWLLEIRKCAPFVPIILVGTDIEIRDNNDEGSIISTERGENFKLLMGAYAFVECSVEHFVGVDDVFIEAVRSTYGRKLRY